MNEKVVRFKRDIPYLYSAKLDGNHYAISVSKPIKNIKFIGQNGTILKERRYKRGTIRTSQYYDIQPSDQYVRTVIQFFDNSTMWLNPVTRHESASITKQRLDHISYLWTAALWMVYLGIILLIIKLVQKYTQNKKIHVQ